MHKTIIWSFDQNAPLYQLRYCNIWKLKLIFWCKIIYTSPNCQRNKIFCCNFWTGRDMNTKLWIFWFYTVIFMSVYAIVMVGSMESRVQNPTKQRECYGMSFEIFRLVADRAGMGPAWQTCAPTSCPATGVASISTDISARMEQNSNERHSAVFTLNADLSLRWAHMPFCRFCHALAHFLFEILTGDIWAHIPCLRIISTLA